MASLDVPVSFYDDNVSGVTLDYPVTLPVDAASGILAYLKGPSLYARPYDASGVGAETAALWTTASSSFASMQYAVLDTNVGIAAPWDSNNTTTILDILYLFNNAGTITAVAATTVSLGFSPDAVWVVPIDATTALVVATNHNTWFSDSAPSTQVNETADVIQKYFVVTVNPGAGTVSCTTPAATPAKYIMYAPGRGGYVLGYHFGYHAPGPSPFAPADFNGVVEVLHLSSGVLTATGNTATLTDADASLTGVAKLDLMWKEQGWQINAHYVAADGAGAVLGLIEDQTGRITGTGPGSTGVSTRLRTYNLTVSSIGGITFDGYSTGYLDERTYFNGSYFTAPRMDYLAGAFRVFYSENLASGYPDPGGITVTVTDPVGGDFTDDQAPNIPVLLELDSAGAVLDRITALYTDIAATYPYGGSGLQTGPWATEQLAPVIFSGGIAGVIFEQEHFPDYYNQWMFMPIVAVVPDVDLDLGDFIAVARPAAEMQARVFDLGGV